MPIFSGIRGTKISFELKGVPPAATPMLSCSFLAPNLLLYHEIAISVHIGHYTTGFANRLGKEQSDNVPGFGHAAEDGRVANGGHDPASRLVDPRCRSHRNRRRRSTSGGYLDTKSPWMMGVCLFCHRFGYMVRPTPFFGRRGPIGLIPLGF